MTKSLINLTDEELAKEYKVSRDESIIDHAMLRFHGLIIHSASKLFLIGGEREDLIQEGRLGLFNALESYDPDKNDKFLPFASLCIQRAQLKAVTSYNRKKNAPLNESLSLDDESKNEETIINLKVSDPEEIILDNFNTEELFSRIERELSPRENEVLLYLIEGYDYKQIAKFLEVEAKSIDNAIQRVRSKVSRILKNKDNE